ACDGCALAYGAIRPCRKIGALRTGLYSSRRNCGGKCARQLPGDLVEIGRTHDVVAVGHRAGLVARHGHRHGPDEVANGRPAEVMPEPATPALLVRGRPSLAKVPDTQRGAR